MPLLAPSRHSSRAERLAPWPRRTPCPDSPLLAAGMSPLQAEGWPGAKLDELRPLPEETSTSSSSPSGSLDQTVIQYFLSLEFPSHPAEIN
eukprot:748217-Hanusia_phi.AAC.1